jgi:hypothetical protein
MTLLALLFVLISTTSAKVLELSDRFLPLRQDGMWLLKVN